MNKKLINALKNTILTFAILHLILLFVYSPFNNQLDKLNIFQIVGLDLFFPGLAGNNYALISYLFPIGVFIFYFKKVK